MTCGVCLTSQLAEVAQAYHALLQMARLIWAVTKGDQKKTDWASVHKKLLKFKKNVEDLRKLPGAEIYYRRLYSIVSNRKGSRRIKKETKPYPDFFTMTNSLVDALRGTESGTEGTNIKLLSPRIAPLMPDRIPSTRRLLSPSVFSFYNEDTPDNIASIPNILEKTGLSDEDKNVVMNLIMSFSGADAALNKTLEALRQLNFFGLDNELFEATKSLNGLFKRVEKSFSKEQQSDIDLKGYAFLEKSQIAELIRGHNVSDPMDVGFDLERYGSLTNEQRHEALWNKIEQIAQNKSRV
uniref:TerB_C domain-containing protein n=1 Tax=Syphacia muris TaxID=451379 RepID=A0A0N5ACB0_9BILA